MEEKLATELLREIKTHSKRWFIAFIVMCLIEIITIGAFIWYISLPVEITETVEIENDDGIASYIGADMNGVITYGESENNKKDH